ncbi:hypothetical protein M0D21_10480 [Aquimarina sp. D1M17]|uniref:hypothetical protein n=1 Tax=Aquimarina acroporae TaxID=2937283 RepID=UPI0020BDDE1B|nr:hypothetical protein [Aquimarina acroporae]MCK8521995.1 hypothetical protein [Aquimarina acroporae]
MSENLASSKQTKKRNNTRIYLIVTSILFGILILPSLPMIMMSPMMFDSPGSEDSTPTIILVLSLVAYPVVTVFGIVVGWILFAKQKHFLSIIFATLPLLNILVGILSVIYMAVFCNGNFDC